MKKIILSAGALALAACGTPAAVTQQTATKERAISGTAPAGAERVLVIDANGNAFDSTPDTAGAFRVLVKSAAPVSLFVIGNGETRVLRVAAAPGETPSITMLPAWDGEVSTAQLQTADANEDGVDEEVIAETNPLDEVDTDEDGTTDLEDSDDDGDGIDDADDYDRDGDGEDDAEADLDSDDDGRPDACDNDDDNDGVDDRDDDDGGDRDDDGVPDDRDQDDDNDAEGDDEDSDDDGDGTDDDGDAPDGDAPDGDAPDGDAPDEDGGEGEGEGDAGNGGAN